MLLVNPVRWAFDHRSKLPCWLHPSEYSTGALLMSTRAATGKQGAASGWRSPRGSPMLAQSASAVIVGLCKRVHAIQPSNYFGAATAKLLHRQLSTCTLLHLHARTGDSHQLAVHQLYAPRMHQRSPLLHVSSHPWPKGSNSSMTFPSIRPGGSACVCEHCALHYMAMCSLSCDCLVLAFVA